MGKIKIGIVGAGIRGNHTYGKYIDNYFDNCEIAFVVEKRKGRRESFCKKYNIKYENSFDSLEDFLSKKLKVDGVIIATGDDRHYDHAKVLLENGYNVLLELPVANTLDRLINLRKIYHKYENRLFMTCNTMIYNEIFIRIKEIINSKELGQLINIQMNENIGYIDYIHNYVRGNWRIDSDTSPLVLNNSCKNLDIILQLIGSDCTKVASFGNLNHMKNEHFKLNMGENCFKCSIENECPYSSKKIYLNNSTDIIYSVHTNPTEENLISILPEGPYGRCVYRCDNNVVDNMVNILSFEDGVNVNLNISAFTKTSDKNIKLLFSKGEIEGSILEQKITIKNFDKKEDKIIELKEDNSFKQGYELKLISDFIEAISSNYCRKNELYFESIIKSHIIAFALEYSRISDEVVYIKDFHESAVNMTDELEKALL